MHNLRLIGRHHTRTVHTVHTVHTLCTTTRAVHTKTTRELDSAQHTNKNRELYRGFQCRCSYCCENLQVKLNTGFQVHPLRLIGRHHTRVKHCALESHWALCRAERYISALYHTVKSTAHSQTVNIHLHPAIVKNDQRNSRDTL